MSERDGDDAGAVLGSTVVWALRALIVLVLLLVSPLALYQLGWNYFDTGGNPLEKFHPATLLVFALLILISCQSGNPIGGLGAMLAREAWVIPYLAANAFMIFYAGTVLTLPVTIFFDVFLGSAIVFLTFQGLPERYGHRLALLVHGLLFLNALLAFADVLTGFRLMPLVVNGEVLADEPRATALLGHPLGNAILMGAYVLALAVGGGRDLPVVFRAICFLTALGSLVPFGGRAATAATLLGLGLVVGRRVLSVLRGEPFDPRTVIAALLVIPVAVFGLVVAFELGAFDTLANRLVDDEGSAGTRIEMFELFRYFSVYDLVFGPDPAVLGTWVRLHGLEYGIESFIVAFVLTYGLLCTFVFMPTFALFLRHVARRCRPGAGLVIIYFVMVALTSVSLSAKSPVLSVFMMLLCVLLRREVHPRQASSASTQRSAP